LSLLNNNPGRVRAVDGIFIINATGDTSATAYRNYLERIRQSSEHQIETTKTSPATEKEPEVIDLSKAFDDWAKATSPVVQIDTQTGHLQKHKHRSRGST
jgi:hypothetical protein